MPRHALDSPADDEPSGRISTALLATIAHVPATAERPSRTPADRAREIARRTSARAAVTAGGLALPPGPLGWLTLLPELISVWKLQAQMVADIAGAYGREASLTREHMLYCLFRHSAAQAVRDLAVRVGEQLLVRHASAPVLSAVAGKVGKRIAKQMAGKGLSRWLPVAGAVGVGAYAWFDTERVARTAIELFEAQATGPEAAADAAPDRAAVGTGGAVIAARRDG